MAQSLERTYLTICFLRCFRVKLLDLLLSTKRFLSIGERFVEIYMDIPRPPFFAM